MNAGHRRLLVIDAAVNLLLGLLLLLFPSGIAAWLGAPTAVSAFYPSILGAVLFGIGLALVLEVKRTGPGPRGLGTAGAICINFCGAGVLAAWLIAAPPAVPLRGQILLWSIAIGVLAIGLVELLSGAWRQ
ncbi:MAG: hypothetical protein QNJ04_08345 [Desulfobacterales bacterium]|nr:hypothetical protein [Desulfobacterales bacterium]